MVRPASDVPGGALSNLDRVREIIAGADFKAFDLKFQRQEEAFAAFRDEVRQEIAALKQAFAAHEQTQGRDAEALEHRVNERLNAAADSVADLRRETTEAAAETKRGQKQTLDSLRDALEARIAETAAAAREGLAERGAADDKRFAALAERCARIEDGAAALASKHGRALDDLAVRITDVRTAFNDAAATLQQTKLSRYALGEVLLAVGAQLLERADKRPRPAAATQTRRTNPD